MKTVNFIEAVNSGKQFRPVDFNLWYSCDSKNNGGVLHNKKDVTVGSDFINAQFELEEKSITITESELIKYCEIVDKAWDKNEIEHNNESFNNHLAYVMGLKTFTS